MDAPSIIETHISTITFVGDRAYKRKKPVRTDFVDFTTLEARSAACRREVELNRRLAPDVYLGVATVTVDPLDGSQPEVLDHLVVMRRLPEDRRLAALLDTDAIGDELDRLARVLATFHTSARRGGDVDAACSSDAVRRLWRDSVAEVAEHAGGIVDAEENRMAGALADLYLCHRSPLLDDRIGAGRCVDGHGDLQADDVFCLPDGPRILDCLEFSDRLRFGDVLADVAFLAMDLERLGHPELATAFLRRYRELAGDVWPRSLEHLWIAYRAHVRAKVACLAARQLAQAGDPSSAATAAEAARRRHALALEHLLDGRVQLVLVGGGPGTGKSTVAASLADRLGAVLLSTDRIRDELVPRPERPRTEAGRPDEPGSGRYARESVDAVYDELLRRAEVALVHGESVVADASWLDPGRRGRARRLAAETGSHPVELRCECPDEVAEERILARAALGADPSEATVRVARSMRRDAPPWPGSTVLDTTRHPDDVTDDAARIAGGDRSVRAAME